jgi:hypothetical protein
VYFFYVVRGYVFANYVLSLEKPPAKALLRCITLGLARVATPSRSSSLWRGHDGSLVELAIFSFSHYYSLLCGVCTRQQQQQQMMMQQMPGHAQQVQPQQTQQAQQAQQTPSPQQVLSPQAKQQQQQQRLQQQQLQVRRVFFSCQPHLVLLLGGARVCGEQRGEYREKNRTGCVAKLLCLCRCSSNKCISSRWAMATITVSQPLLPPLAVLQATIWSKYPLVLYAK